jgi:hypothetical protein
MGNIQICFIDLPQSVSINKQHTIKETMNGLEKLL